MTPAKWLLFAAALLITAALAQSPMGKNSSVGTTPRLPNGSVLTDNGDGTFLLTKAAGSGFVSLQFGGTTAAFPMLKRSVTAIQFRTADNSADAPIFASNVVASGNVTGVNFVGTPTTPASSSAPCNQGTIVWDAAFIYVCTATDTWMRSALSTF